MSNTVLSVLTSKFREFADFSRCSGENLLPCIFQLQEATYFPWYMIPFLYLQVQQSSISLTYLPLSHLPVVVKSHVIRLHMQTILKNLLTPYLKVNTIKCTCESILTSKVTCPQIQKIRRQKINQTGVSLFCYHINE